MKKALVFVPFLASVALNCAFAASYLDWRMLPAAVVGWYLADFISGATHMYMDYRPCISGRGLGELFAYQGSRDSTEYQALQKAAYARISPFERIVFDFKKHHPRPDALGRRTLAHQTRTTVMFLTLPASLALNLAWLNWRFPTWLLAGLVVLLIGSTLSQYFHGTLHREHNPPVILAMRRLRLLMTPGEHASHHASLAEDFSVISGWSNPLLNALFRVLQKHGALDSRGLEPT